MNITIIDSKNWDVESESRPGNYYRVINGSQQAINNNVPYSCDCKSWVNNQYNRNCKHIEAVKDLIKNNIITNVSNRHAHKIQTPSYSTYRTNLVRRSRGPPPLRDTNWCDKCGKRSIMLKEEGICKHCGWKKGDTIKREPAKSTVPRVKSITDQTVELKDDAIRSALEKLGIE